MMYLGDFPEDATVYIPFNTFSSDDPSASVTITNLADADIKVHKDGNAVEATTDGATVSIDFDTVTGNHLVTIDTSVDAFYAVGSDYMVRIEGTTVDGATINAWVGIFSIENRHYGNDVSAAEVNAQCDTAIADASLATSAALAIVDSNVDAVLVDTSTTIPAQITALNDLSAADVNAQCDIAIADAGLATASALTTVEGKIDTVDTVVDGIQTDLSNATDGLGAIKGAVDGLNNLSAADVNAEVDTALADIHLDHLLATDYDPATPPGAATALLNELVESDGGVSRFTANALEQAPSGGGAVADWTAAEREEIRDRLGITGTTSAPGGTPSLATAASLATVEGKVDTVDAVVDGIQTDLSNGTDGLGAIKADTAAILTNTGTTIPATLSDIQGATFNAATDSLEAIRNHGDSAWTTAAGFATSGDIAALNDFDPATDGVNVTQIAGSTEAADDLSASASTIERAQAAAGTLTTTAMTTNLTEDTDDHYNGRIIIWTSGALRNQATNITDYNGTTKELTFTAVTEAPTAGDTFVIV